MGRILSDISSVFTVWVHIMLRLTLPCILFWGSVKLVPMNWCNRLVPFLEFAGLVPKFGTSFVSLVHYFIFIWNWAENLSHKIHFYQFFSPLLSFGRNCTSMSKLVRLISHQTYLLFLDYSSTPEIHFDNCQDTFLLTI